MDCAKAVGARIAKPNQSIQEMAGILRIFKKTPLLFVVPTTAGTGSETTVATVITDPIAKHKYMISDFPLIPKYAVLDPKIVKSLPPYITATTGMDVLVHAIEAYIGKSTSKTTRKQAIEAIKLIFENIEIAYNEPNNYEARKNMLIASNLAGKAFSMSYVGYVHAVAHTLGGKYNVPHGLANSILLPYFLKDYSKAIYKKIYTIAISIGSAEKNSSYKEAYDIFIKALDDLLVRLNIPQTIKGIKKEDIPSMAITAAKEANHIYPVPVMKTAKELEKYYYLVSDEK
jgi:alcohol dehydrogenase class IV